MEKVIYIGALAVETDNFLIASNIALKALESNQVRGKSFYKGKSYRWSTIQQYEHHQGFEVQKL
jgi:hypothetical protein